MWKFFGKLMYLIGLLAMAGLIGAYAASYVNPNSFILPALLGVMYPYLLIGNIVLFFYWTLRWKKMAWLQLIVLLLGVPAFLTYYGLNDDSEAIPDAGISVLSYNVRFTTTGRRTNLRAAGCSITSTATTATSSASRNFP